ncbi:hypothetical protein LTR37_019166 [Vermiconidia calcicola]|uniref:Uncharacterized protein n=1 Tax=Vermiconidia calcicola TaxID=1690605 RepID=A0ACC3MF32_9PEZI|nr:hypothetical protein LTR37_019166 [Vermiconidia calcicola]
MQPASSSSLEVLCHKRTTQEFASVWTSATRFLWLGVEIDISGALSSLSPNTVTYAVQCSCRRAVEIAGPTTTLPPTYSQNMSTTQHQPFVRQYNSSTDFEAVVHIFRETADGSLKVEPIWTIGSYLWCRPYLTLSPSTCFVIDDGCGRAVGYVLGVSDSAAFCEAWNEVYVPIIERELERLLPIDGEDGQGDPLSRRRDELVQLVRSPERAIFSSYRKQLEAWPGHLHIDILPSHQRMGFGRQLVDTMCKTIKAEGCSGLYLGMVASNDQAARFYEALGFRRLPHVLDDHASGELGRTKKGDDGGATIYFVTDL